MKRKYLKSGWLVMAATLIVSLSSCSSDDNNIEQSSIQQEDGTKIHVTVNAGFSDGETTRSAVVTSEEEGTVKRMLTFTESDRIYIYAKVDDSGSVLLTGYLSIKSGSINNEGKSATFSGDLTLTGSHTFGSGNPLSECYKVYSFFVHGGSDGFVENGTSSGYAYKPAADVKTLMTTSLNLSGFYYEGTIYFDRLDPIINFTIIGLTANTEYTVSGVGFEGNVTTDAHGIASFATAILYPTEQIRLKSGSEIHTISFNQISRASRAGKIHNIYTSTSASYNTIDLTGMTTVPSISDGAIITGTVSGRLPIKIPDGATVMLKNVDITYDTSWAGYSLYPGIWCQGDATIVLVGSNTVTGIGEDGGYGEPGVYVPTGKTLTILGPGSLSASSSGPQAAGIGSDNNWQYKDCGNIIIEGGTVTATGGDKAPGIGSVAGACGTIDIKNTVTCVTATKGSDDAAFIGKSVFLNSTCGNVRFGDVTAYNSSQNEWIPLVDGNTYGGLKLTIDGSSYILKPVE